MFRKQCVRDALVAFIIGLLLTVGGCSQGNGAADCALSPVVSVTSPCRGAVRVAGWGCRTISDDLPEPMRRDMTDFFVRELRATSWLRAVSPFDQDAGYAIRADHQWNGAYPAWPPEAARARSPSVTLRPFSTGCPGWRDRRTRVRPAGPVHWVGDRRNRWGSAQDTRSTALHHRWVVLVCRVLLRHGAGRRLRHLRWPRWDGLNLGG